MKITQLCQQVYKMENLFPVSFLNGGPQQDERAKESVPLLHSPFLNAKGSLYYNFSSYLSGYDKLNS